MRLKLRDERTVGIGNRNGVALPRGRFSGALFPDGMERLDFPGIELGDERTVIERPDGRRCAHESIDDEQHDDDGCDDEEQLAKDFQDGTISLILGSERLRLEARDDGQIPIEFPIVEAVTYDKGVGTTQADVIERHVDETALRLL